MKKILLIAAILALAGCSNKYEERKFPVLPPELKDCKFFEIENDHGDEIEVARCPNSTTTTQVRHHTGKSSHDHTFVLTT